MTILPNLQQQIDQLRQQNEALQALLAAASKPKALTMKVSEKGALSMYGMGKWPVTLYKSQIKRILAHVDEIEAFIKANDHLLAVKGE